MKTIGITGGVGCGKSKVLEYINNNYNCLIILADDIGNKVKEPGNACYDELISILGKGVLNNDGMIDKKKMADMIFNDDLLLQRVNNVIHPAVEKYFIELRDQTKEKGIIDYFFIEAALLIECGYRKHVDELWYIYADERVRRQRLKESRGYSDSKIDSIMSAQLSEEQFRQSCDRVIDNSKELIETYKQIDEFMRIIGESSGRQ